MSTADWLKRHVEVTRVHCGYVQKPLAHLGDHIFNTIISVAQGFCDTMTGVIHGTKKSDITPLSHPLITAGSATLDVTLR